MPLMSRQQQLQVQGRRGRCPVRHSSWTWLSVFDARACYVKECNSEWWTTRRCNQRMGTIGEKNRMAITAWIKVVVVAVVLVVETRPSGACDLPTLALYLARGELLS